MTTDGIERRKVLLSINNKNYNFREKKRSQVLLKFYLVDLNNNFECDWLTELFYNNSTSELVENRSFLNQYEEIVIFMISSRTYRKCSKRSDYNNVIFKLK